MNTEDLTPHVKQLFLVALILNANLIHVYLRAAIKCAEQDSLVYCSNPVERPWYN